MKGDIQINDHVFSPNGYRKLTEKIISFEKSKRTIDNTLVSDFMAVKKTFTISWDDCAIDGELLNEFMELYLSAEDVTFIKTNYDLTTSAYTCRIKLSDSFKRVYESRNYSYSGVNVTLEEV